MPSSSQFDLLGTRRFLPLFVTQFLGAFNDNLLKNALVVLVTFQGLSLAGMPQTTLLNVAAGLFILPYFLFSALAGQLAEKYDKAWLARWIKRLEIAIMLLAAGGFLGRNAPILFGCLFLLGVHSTFFGPLKYSILPQYLSEWELVGGNGLIEAGTFVAILGGEIVGSMAPGIAPWLLIALALAGLASSHAMPAAAPPAPKLKVGWNVVAETGRLIRQASRNRDVFIGLLAISWFWLFGSVYLIHLPELARVGFAGGSGAYTLLLALFSVGLGVGSALCEKLSGHRVELGLVPFGALGMTLFALDLYFAATRGMAGRGWVDVFLIGAFGGLYSVPLYAWIQLKSEKSFLSRTIAANNVLNAAAMVIGSMACVALLSTGMGVLKLLGLTALANGLALGAIVKLWPAPTLRFLTWILAKLFYRVRCVGQENLPVKGGFVLLCNHVSFVDWLFVAAMVPRPVRFVIDHHYYRTRGLGWLFRMAGIVPIAPRSESEEVKAAAFDRIASYLEKGEPICLFPEGAITRTGELQGFRRGIEQIIARTPVPVVPASLNGLWGSFFSRKDGPAMKKWPRRFRARVELTIGAPMKPGEVTLERLEEQVASLASAAG